MSKILCLYSNKSSSWISCQKIVANLWESYKATSSKVSSRHFGPEQKSQELIELAEKIVTESPEVISFIDHRPHPYDLLQYLIPFWLKENKPLPKIIFHVYGDFTLNYHKWAMLASLLKGIEVEFCAASSAEKKLIEKLTLGSVNLIPFSVNPQEFYLDDTLRKKTRERLSIQPSQRLFIFSGRLSYQKNIHVLVREFLKYLEIDQSQDQLLLFGHFDDLGDSFTGYKSLTGHYFHEVNNLLKDHPLKNQIHFMGMVNSKELHAYYNACDYFINLSTHNDEDFGMSVAEASFCGLASILTSWGGLNDFNFATTKYLPVSIEGEKKIDLNQLSFNLTPSYDRQKLAEEAKRRFSIQAATEKIELMLSAKPSTFSDFSELFYKAQHMSLYTEKMYLDFNNKLNSLYKELYDSYLG